MAMPQLPMELERIRKSAVGKCMEELECVGSSIPEAPLRIIKDIVKRYLYIAVRDAGRVPSPTVAEDVAEDDGE